jgi:hypothetical protein
MRPLARVRGGCAEPGQAVVGLSGGVGASSSPVILVRRLLLVMLVMAHSVWHRAQMAALGVSPGSRLRTCWTQSGQGGIAAPERLTVWITGTVSTSRMASRAPIRSVRYRYRSPVSLQITAATRFVVPVVAAAKATSG